MVIHKKGYTRKKPSYSSFDYAIFLLGRKPYPFKEMYDKLIQRGYSEKETQDATSRLKELGYLDDALFAKNRVRSRADFSSWGKSKIIQELKQKGVAAEHIENAISFWEEGADEWVQGEVSSNSWKDNAVDLLQRKYGAWPEDLPLDAPLGTNWEEKQAHFKEVQKEKSRRINFLIRRGFSIEEAQAAFEALLGL